MKTNYLKLYVKYLIEICEVSILTRGRMYDNLKSFYETGRIKGYVAKNDKFEFKVEQISHIANDIGIVSGKNVMTYKEFRTYHLINDM